MDFQIFDEQDSTAAKISTLGEQYVAPRFYSSPYYISVEVANTPYSVVPAISGQKFIITGLLLSSDKAFASATVAETLVIYEASPADISTNLKTVAQVDFLRNDRLVATSLNLATSDAVSLVAEATDAKVDVTIAGYYVPC